MSGFVKLDTGVLNSSLWIERDLRSIFITALVMAEPVELKQPTAQLAVRSLDETGWMVPPGWYGFVPAAGTGIVRRDGMDDIEQGLDLLEKLCSPDPDSRSQKHDGRRMARVDGGYLILNYFDYRDRDYTAADRMRRLRARKKEQAAPVTANTVDVTANVTQAESREQSSNADSSPPPTKRMGESTVDYPWLTLDYLDDWRELERRIEQHGGSPYAWRAELKAALDGMHGPARTPQEISQAIRDFNASGADISLRLFRGYLRGNSGEKVAKTNGGRQQGKTMAAASIIAKLRKENSVPNPYAGGMSLRPDWRERFDEGELKVVDAFTTRRILDASNDSALTSQLAKALEEIGQ